MIRPRFTAPFAYLALAGVAAGQSAPPLLTEPPGLQTIRAADLQATADFLASDQLGGRLTGSPGQVQAADYIVKQFEALKLAPAGDRLVHNKQRLFRQKYPLVRTFLDRAATGITVGEEAEEIRRGFAVLPAAGEPGAVVATGPFVYAGLVNTRSFKKGVELESWKGKIPVFVIDLPEKSPDFGIQQQMGIGMFLLGSIKRRAERMAKSGAEVALFCVLDDEAVISNMLTYVALAPGQDMMSKPDSKGQMESVSTMAQASVPTVFLGRTASTAVLKAIGLTPEAAGKAPAPAAVAALRTPAGRVRLSVKRDTEAFGINVVGLLRGSDPLLRHEAIFYSAHMDHVGLRLDGDAYNGADDNASGTAGLLAIAKAYASLKTPPKRSIVFLAVSGEELGLWGSAHHMENPGWPLVDIIANINTDMIGRNGPESGPMEITVTPSHRHPKFSTIVRDAARVGARLGIKFANGDKYYARSDHYNFAKAGIPVVFFCNGEHEDYHQVSDHSDKLDAAKMERIARLAYWTGYLVAQGESRPTVLGPAKDWLPVAPDRGK